VRGDPAVSTRSLALSVGAAVLLADQLTKWWAIEALSDGPVTVVDGFLSLRYVTNPGAAFGMLPGAGSIIALAAIAAVVFIVVVVRSVDLRGEAVALGLVMGGALGNLCDRVFRGGGLLDGEVVDFVDFDFFPAFNVADSAITIGALLALLLALRPEPEPAAAAGDGPG
jgi:signal peptidase II